MATDSSKGSAMGFLQLAIGIIGLVVGLVTLTKESAPYVKRIREQSIQHENMLRATEQANMNLQYIYRGNDGTYRYYSDNSGVYWYRTNIEGIVEYARNPNVPLLR